MTRIFHVNVNCSDLERCAAFYAGRSGSTPRSVLPRPQPSPVRRSASTAWWDAWILVGANGFEGGAIDLLEWRAAPRRCTAASFSSAGSSVGIGVPDLGAAVDRIGRLGGGIWSTPTEHALPDGSHVRLVMANDPDGTAIECIEGAATRVSFVAVCCSDLEYSLAFYRGLGFEERARFASDTADAAHLHLPGPMGMDEIMLSAPGGGEVRARPRRSACLRATGRPGPPARSACGAPRCWWEISARHVPEARRANRDARPHRGDADGPGPPALRFICFTGPDHEVIELIEQPQ
jgi:catechol 2,3-dioxygenase-like lactoylglutathione lyase family enzyme